MRNLRLGEMSDLPKVESQSCHPLSCENPVFFQGAHRSLWDG